MILDNYPRSSFELAFTKQEILRFAAHEGAAYQLQHTNRFLASPPSLTLIVEDHSSK